MKRPPEVASARPEPSYAAATSRTGPSSSSRPPWMSSAREQVATMALRSWLTKSTVRPSWLTSPMRARHFSRNLTSPTASTSSTSRMAGFRCAATENASRRNIPLE